MNKLFIATLLLSITGCTGVIQTGSVSEAYKNYERQKYEKTLALISRAETLRAANPGLEAKLTYLKAQTYEQMGEAEIAETLYQYLRDQHPHSQYGYLAAKRLGDNHGTNWIPGPDCPPLLEATHRRRAGIPEETAGHARVFQTGRGGAGIWLRNRVDRH